MSDKLMEQSVGLVAQIVDAFERLFSRISVLELKCAELGGEAGSMYDGGFEAGSSATEALSEEDIQEFDIAYSRYEDRFAYDIRNLLAYKKLYLVEHRRESWAAKEIRQYIRDWGWISCGSHDGNR